MRDLIKSIMSLFVFNMWEQRDPEIQRWAETEYKKDTDYAYYMLKNGKYPSFD